MTSLISRAVNAFGSDVYTHYTAVYTWNSNQMAHAMMGFAGTMLFIHAATRLGLEFWYGAFFYVLPLLKDITDVVADLSVRTHQFKMKAAHRREIWLDALTDNFFWTAGLMLALFVMAMSCEDRPWWSCLIILAVFLIFTIGIFVAKRHFNEQKKQFDVSGLPYYFRLPRYSGKLSANSNNDSSERKPIEEVENFVYEDRARASHLLIYGPPRSFKTTLAVAIGSGLTVRRRAVRYLSKSRLIEECAPATPADRSTAVPIPPHKADVVIVDDLDKPDGLQDILPALANKSTVWVVSSSSRTQIDEWMNRIGSGLSDPPIQIELESNQELSQTPSYIVNALALITLVSFISIAGALALLMLPPSCELLCLYEVQSN
ncbi:MAG: hypothetical protein OXF88_00240 [Rhodobacteraceae bacterium]|nr:hypothetical protein [Paracoccaceae bacterium]